ncbi:MAG TPA: PRC-barrel domain-containing protein [Mycobacteriales bacterium]|jgi:uncharacterized protein YrrD
MSVLMRATEIMKRPVVTLAGEDVAQIKDIVYAGAEAGEVAGFTLAGRGLFSGPRKEALPWSAVHGLGRDAVMIADEQALDDRQTVVEKGEARGGDVLGSRVLTDDGVDLGKVVDVILEVGRTADVVGYAIDSTEALGRDGRTVLIPLPDTIAVSGEALIVPSATTEFVTDDLSGFGAAVEAFRTRLRGGV